MSITERIRSVLSPGLGTAYRANKGKAFFVTITTKEGDEWTKWAPFSVYISDQAIDSHLVYRLIEPGYEKWHIVGIYQRNLESFDEQPIIRNDMTGYNCMNCHSFCMGDPGQMMFHMRAANGGTYIVQDKKISKLNTKTNGTISNMTYPFWHPSGRYITTSVNDIKQFFHKDNQTIVEWYFKNQMDGGQAEAFDGISLIEWTSDNKIALLKEFGCNENRYDPYKDGNTPQFKDENAKWF